jgi:hypothetical protein
LIGLLALAGCHRDMRDQAKVNPGDPSDFFGDGRSMRPPVEGTVARGQLRADSLLYTGKVQGKPAGVFPFPVTYAVLQRGRERYDIFCAPCHDWVGTGRGIVVQRGMRPPSSFHVDRLRSAPPGYFFDVMTNGFGAMYDLAAQLKPEDRWAITAYIRALQLSQKAALDLVPASERAGLDHPEIRRESPPEGGH